MKFKLMEAAGRAQVIAITAAATLAMVLLFALARQLNASMDSRVVRVGYIYDGDESMPYTENFMRARRAVEAAYGSRVQCVEFFNVKAESIDSIYDDVLEAGCDIVFATSYGFCKAIREWAKLNPQIEFCQATGDDANTGEVLPNYHNYMGTIYQGRYAAGLVAGMKLKELIEKGGLDAERAKVGYVAAFPCAEVISGYTAFFIGVRSHVPTAKMSVAYTNTWGSYAREKEAAKRLIRSGCVIISQHSDTNGPAVACQELNLEYPAFHVGYNGSATDIAPTASLASCRINWAPYQIAAVGAALRGKKIESCVSGKVRGNDAWAGFDKGWVEVIDINEYIAAPGTREAVQEAIAAFKKNKISVFSGSYTGTKPLAPDDRIDLSKTPFHENADSSAPKFSYLLDGVIEVTE